MPSSTAPSAALDFYNFFGYEPALDAFLVKVMRDPAVNPTCATTGAQFKTALGPAAAMAGAFPDDICLSDQALTDGRVIWASALTNKNRRKP